jgi:hypothetical protein
MTRETDLVDAKKLKEHCDTLRDLIASDRATIYARR